MRALLDFARENAEERHVVALDDVVRSTVDLVRRTNAHKGVELVDTYDDAGALVYASPNQLKQIFLNLIANARQAMPNGGTVTVDVRTEGGFAVATVSDDGPGHRARRARAHLRAVLHDEAQHRRHRPRPLGQPRHRRGSRRRTDRVLRSRARRARSPSACPLRRGGQR